MPKVGMEPIRKAALVKATIAEIGRAGSLDVTVSQIAKRAGWHWIRMNLNTMQRHKVFDRTEMVDLVCRKLTDRDAIAKARVFPYQLLAAYQNIGSDIPRPVREALQEAAEIAVANVPVLSGEVAICPDVSASMTMSVTGQRNGSTSKVTCVDVAGLVTAAVLRKNDTALVLPFAYDVRPVNLAPAGTILDNATSLGRIVGGGTACSAPVKWLNSKEARAKLVVLISDNQSWLESKPTQDKRDTALMTEWNRYKGRNPDAKLVCLDIVPGSTTQAQERPDILNVGGFSDSVFNIIHSFVNGELHPDHWVGLISTVDLNEGSGNDDSNWIA